MLKAIFQSKKTTKEKIDELKKITTQLEFLDILSDPTSFLEDFIPFTNQVFNEIPPDSTMSFGPENEMRVFFIRLLSKFNYNGISNPLLLEIIYHLFNTENIFNRYLTLKILFPLLDSNIQVDYEIHLNCINTFFKSELPSLEGFDTSRCKLGFFSAAEALNYLKHFQVVMKLPTEAYEEILYSLAGALKVYFIQRFIEEFYHNKKISCEFCLFGINLFQFINTINIPNVHYLIPFIPELCYTLCNMCPRDCVLLQCDVLDTVTSTLFVYKDILFNLDKYFLKNSYLVADSPLLKAKNLKFLSELMKNFDKNMTKIVFLEFDARICDYIPLHKDLNVLYSCIDALTVNLSSAMQYPMESSELKLLVFKHIKNANKIYKRLHLPSYCQHGEQLPRNNDNTNNLNNSFSNDKESYTAHTDVFHATHDNFSNYPSSTSIDNTVYTTEMVDLKFIAYLKVFVKAFAIVQIPKVLDWEDILIFGNLILFPHTREIPCADYLSLYNDFPIDTLESILLPIIDELLINFYSQVFSWNVLLKIPEIHSVFIKTANVLIHKDFISNTFHPIEFYHKIFPLSYGFFKIDKRYTKMECTELFSFIFDSFLNFPSNHTKNTFPFDTRMCIGLINSMFLDIKSCEIAYTGLYFIYDTFENTVKELYTLYTLSFDTFYLECLFNIPVSLNLLVTKYSILIPPMIAGLKSSKKLREIVMKYVEYIIEFDTEDGGMNDLLVLIYDLLQEHSLKAINVFSRISNKHRDILNGGELKGHRLPFSRNGSGCSDSCSCISGDDCDCINSCRCKLSSSNSKSCSCIYSSSTVCIRRKNAGNIQTTPQHYIEDRILETQEISETIIHSLKKDKDSNVTKIDSICFDIPCDNLKRLSIPALVGYEFTYESDTRKLSYLGSSDRTLKGVDYSEESSDTARDILIDYLLRLMKLDVIILSSRNNNSGYLARQIKDVFNGYVTNNTCPVDKCAISHKNIKEGVNNSCIGGGKSKDIDEAEAVHDAFINTVKYTEGNGYTSYIESGNCSGRLNYDDAVDHEELDWLNSVCYNYLKNTKLLQSISDLSLALLIDQNEKSLEILQTIYLQITPDFLCEFVPDALIYSFETTIQFLSFIFENRQGDPSIQRFIHRTIYILIDFVYAADDLKQNRALYALDAFLSKSPSFNAQKNTTLVKDLFYCIFYRMKKCESFKIYELALSISFTVLNRFGPESTNIFEQLIEKFTKNEHPYLRSLIFEVQSTYNMHVGLEILPELHKNCALRIFNYPKLVISKIENLSALCENFLKNLNKKDTLSIKIFLDLLKKIRDNESLFADILIPVKRYLPPIAVLEGFSSLEVRRKFVENVNRNGNFQIQNPNSLKVFRNLFYDCKINNSIKASVIDFSNTPGFEHKNILLDILINCLEYDVLSFDFLMTKLSEMPALTISSIIGISDETKKIYKILWARIQAQVPSIKDNLIMNLIERINISFVYNFVECCVPITNEITNVLTNFLNDFLNSSHTYREQQVLIKSAYNILRYLKKKKCRFNDNKAVLIVYRDLYLLELEIDDLVNWYFKNFSPEDIEVLFRINSCFLITSECLISKLVVVESTSTRNWMLNCLKKQLGRVNNGCSNNPTFIDQNYKDLFMKSIYLENSRLVDCGGFLYRCICFYLKSKGINISYRGCEKAFEGYLKPNDLNTGWVDANRNEMRRSFDNNTTPANRGKNVNAVNVYRDNGVQEQSYSFSNDSNDYKEDFGNDSESTHSLFLECDKSLGDSEELFEMPIESEYKNTSSQKPKQLDKKGVQAKHDECTHKPMCSKSTSTHKGESTRKCTVSFPNNASSSIPVSVRNSTTSYSDKLSVEKGLDNNVYNYNIQNPRSTATTSNSYNNSYNTNNIYTVTLKDLSVLLPLFHDSINLIVELFCDLRIYSKELVKFCVTTPQASYRFASLFYLSLFDPKVELFEDLFILNYQESKYVINCLKLLVDQFGTAPFYDSVKTVLRSEMRFKTTECILVPFLLSDRRFFEDKEILFEVCVFAKRIVSKGTVNYTLLEFINSSSDVSNAFKVELNTQVILIELLNNKPALFDTLNYNRKVIMDTKNIRIFELLERDIKNKQLGDHLIGLDTNKIDKGLEENVTSDTDKRTTELGRVFDKETMCAIFIKSNYISLSKAAILFLGLPFATYLTSTLDNQMAILEIFVECFDMENKTPLKVFKEAPVIDMLNNLVTHKYPNLTRFNNVYPKLIKMYPSIVDWLVTLVVDKEFVYPPLFEFLPDVFETCPPEIAVSLCLKKPSNIPIDTVETNILHLFKLFPFSLDSMKLDFFNCLLSKNKITRKCYLDLLMSHTPSNIFLCIQYIFLFNYNNLEEYHIEYFIMAALYKVLINTNDILSLGKCCDESVNTSSCSDLSIKSAAPGLSNKKSERVSDPSLSNKILASPSKKSKSSGNDTSEDVITKTTNSSTALAFKNSQTTCNNLNHLCFGIYQHLNTFVPSISDILFLQKDQTATPTWNYTVVVESLLQGVFNSLDKQNIYYLQNIFINNFEQSYRIKLPFYKAFVNAGSTVFDFIFNPFSPSLKFYQLADRDLYVGLVKSRGSIREIKIIIKYLEEGNENDALTKIFEFFKKIAQRQVSYNMEDVDFLELEVKRIYNNNGIQSAQFLKTFENAKGVLMKGNPTKTIASTDKSKFFAKENFVKNLSKENFCFTSSLRNVTEIEQIEIKIMKVLDSLENDRNILEDVRSIVNSLSVMYYIPRNNLLFAKLLMFASVTSEIVESSIIMKDNLTDSIFGRFRMWMLRHPSFLASFIDWNLFMKWRSFIFNKALGLVAENDKKKISTEMCKLNCIYSSKAFKEKLYLRSSSILNEVSSITTVEINQNMQRTLLDLENLYNLKEYSTMVSLINSLNITKFSNEEKSRLYYWIYKALKRMGKSADSEKYGNLSRKLSEIIENKKDDLEIIKERLRFRNTHEKTLIEENFSSAGFFSLFPAMSNVELEGSYVNKLIEVINELTIEESRPYVIELLRQPETMTAQLEEISHRKLYFFMPQIKESNFLINKNALLKSSLDGADIFENLYEARIKASMSEANYRKVSKEEDKLGGNPTSNVQSSCINIGHKKLKVAHEPEVKKADDHSIFNIKQLSDYLSVLMNSKIPDINKIKQIATAFITKQMKSNFLRVSGSSKFAFDNETALPGEFSILRNKYDDIKTMEYVEDCGEGKDEGLVDVFIVRNSDGSLCKIIAHDNTEKSQQIFQFMQIYFDIQKNYNLEQLNAKCYVIPTFYSKNRKLKDKSIFNQCKEKIPFTTRKSLDNESLTAINNEKTTVPSSTSTLVEKESIEDEKRERTTTALKSNKRSDKEQLTERFVTFSVHKNIDYSSDVLLKLQFLKTGNPLHSFYSKFLELKTTKTHLVSLCDSILQFKNLLRNEVLDTVGDYNDFYVFKRNCINSYSTVLFFQYLINVNNSNLENIFLDRSGNTYLSSVSSSSDKVYFRPNFQTIFGPEGINGPFYKIFTEFLAISCSERAVDCFTFFEMGTINEFKKKTLIANLQAKDENYVNTIISEMIDPKTAVSLPVSSCPWL